MGLIEWALVQFDLGLVCSVGIIVQLGKVKILRVYLSFLLYSKRRKLITKILSI